MTTDAKSAEDEATLLVGKSVAYPHSGDPDRLFYISFQKNGEARWLGTKNQSVPRKYKPTGKPREFEIWWEERPDLGKSLITATHPLQRLCRVDGENILHRSYEGGIVFRSYTPALLLPWFKVVFLKVLAFVSMEFDVILFDRHHVTDTKREKVQVMEITITGSLDLFQH